jgi:CheY-like chemotaxis protein
MCKILLVEDCMTARVQTELILRHAGRHKVCSVGSGAEAVETALSDPPDVVVMDVVMAGMDGAATLQALRSHQVTCPVLAYTAIPERSPGEFEQQGFSAYVPKAQHLSCLLHTVYDLMHK